MPRCGYKPGMKRLIPLAFAVSMSAGLACTEESAETSKPPSSAEATPSAADAPVAEAAPPAEKSATAAREIAIEVKQDGYHPAEVKAQPGEEVVLVFTRTSESRCAEKLVVPAADVERDLPLNEPVRVELTAPASGQLAFACGMDMLQGALVVH